MSTKVLNGLDLNGQRITSLGDPSSATDSANKQYVDNTAAGLDWKENVRAASTANMTVASAVINGASMDGVTLATGNRVLLKNQTTASENGIYIVAASGAASRATDADTAADITNMIVRVSEGTTLGDTMWQLVTDNITLGSTSLVYTQFTGGGGTYTADGQGIEVSANQFSLELDSSSGLSKSATGLKIDSSVVVRKFAGNCAATTNPQTFTHNLGTLDVIVSVVEVSTGALVVTDITAATTNTVSVNFGGAPTSAQYRVVVFA